MHAWILYVYQMNDEWLSSTPRCTMTEGCSGIMHNAADILAKVDISRCTDVEILRERQVTSVIISRLVSLNFSAEIAGQCIVIGHGRIAKKTVTTHTVVVLGEQGTIGNSVSHASDIAIAIHVLLCGGRGQRPTCGPKERPDTVWRPNVWRRPWSINEIRSRSFDTLEWHVFVFPRDGSIGSCEPPNLRSLPGSLPAFCTGSLTFRSWMSCLGHSFVGSRLPIPCRGFDAFMISRILQYPDESSLGVVCGWVLVNLPEALRTMSTLYDHIHAEVRIVPHS